jgi:hypothetical protein
MPEPPAAEKKRDLDERARPSRKLLYAGGLVGLIAMLGAGALYAGRGESPSPLATELTDKVAKGVTGVTAAVGSAVSAIGERVGLSGDEVKPSPTETAKPPVVPAVASTTKRSGGMAPQKAVPELQRATLSAFDLDGLPQAPVRQTESIVIVAEPASIGGETPAAASLDPIVYSSDSRGVTPPVGLRPQFPTELPADVRAEDLTRIELVILPDGTVDSVKLLDRPRNIHAFMLLSAAKAWQFRPATKDGEPVRYRKTFWVAR